ncbi:MAG: hypothetical protein K2X08_08170, partial [Chlamydiales bacterium]|nr:hypothetical protein [Chlamydiales bacterium]
MDFPVMTRDLVVGFKGEMADELFKDMLFLYNDLKAKIYAAWTLPKVALNPLLIQFLRVLDYLIGRASIEFEDWLKENHTLIAQDLQGMRDEIASENLMENFENVMKLPETNSSQEEKSSMSTEVVLRNAASVVALPFFDATLDKAAETRKEDEKIYLQQYLGWLEEQRIIIIVDCKKLLDWINDMDDFYNELRDYNEINEKKLIEILFSEENEVESIQEENAELLESQEMKEHMAYFETLREEHIQRVKEEEAEEIELESMSVVALHDPIEALSTTLSELHGSLIAMTRVE